MCKEKYGQQKDRQEELTLSQVLPGEVGVVLREEGMILDLVDIHTSQTALARGEKVADQGHAARTHDDVVREMKCLLVIHDIGVSTH